MNLPLKGIKVLDLSRYLPGPFCTQILADFGAEVIKVEEPVGGDLGRGLPPLIGGEGTLFYAVNRNKKSITLNLKTEKGKEIFKQLVAESDVVIEQFRPGVMDKLGVGFDTLKEINDKIIYCAITGYGLDGPLKDAAGHDLNYLSLAGITGLTGTFKGSPAMSGVQIADIAGGTLYSIIAILLALASRSQTGKGQLCDVSMLDTSISLLAYTLGEWSGLGALPERGNEQLTGGYACYNVYATKDNKNVSIGAIEAKFWIEFCKKIDRTEYIKTQWAKDKQADMIEDIKNILLQKTRAEWEEFFSESDICFTPVLTIEEMAENSQVKAREMIIKMLNFKDTGKDLALTGIPIKLSATPGKAVLEFPELGEHTEEVLQAAGYSLAEIEKFRNDKVV